MPPTSSTSSRLSLLPSFPIILALSAVLRIALILYSEWHDRHSVVKYTDVDYRVFSDAAHFLLNPDPGGSNRAQGPLNKILEALGVSWRANIGDPYTRETYRYTPLLALLLAPNAWLPSFGKYLFAACDLLNGVLIYRLLVSEILPQENAKTRRQQKTGPTPAPVPKTTNTNTKPKPEPEPEPELQTTTRRAALYASLHLLNPLVFTISTRGSSEAVLASFVLLALYAGLKGRWVWAGALLGLGVHWKIYPVVYGVGCLGVVGASNSRGRSGEKDRGGGGVWAYVGTLVNWKTVRFAAAGAGTYALLSGACYLVWGYPFVYESYLYHLHRLDHRHNFSPYFYLTYLTYPGAASAAALGGGALSRFARSPLVSFVPQMGLALGTGLLFGRRRRDLVFTWFVQTVVFVLFNKVCTSQYFLWYLLLLPLLLPQLRTTPARGAAYAAVWAGTQGLWLGEAYRLEFLGARVFWGVWVRGCVYVLGNAWVLAGVMGDYVA